VPRDEPQRLARRLVLHRLLRPGGGGGARPQPQRRPGDAGEEGLEGQPAAVAGLRAQAKDGGDFGGEAGGAHAGLSVRGDGGGRAASRVSDGPGEEERRGGRGGGPGG